MTVVLSDSDDLEVMTSTPAAGKEVYAGSTQRTRALKSVVDADKSLAFENLPDLLKPLLDNKTGLVMPTLRDFYGAQPDPWAIGTDELYQSLLQAIIDYVEPESGIVVVKGDKLWKYVSDYSYA